MAMKTKKNYTKETHNNAEFEARIGRVVKEFSNEQESISLEEIESWVAQDNMKKRIKRKKIMSIAACFIIICGMGLTMRFYANADNSVVMAGGDDVEVTTGENGGGNEYVRTDWDEAMKLAEEYPDMLIPDYVPEGYEFKQLKVETGSVGVTYKFAFQDAKNKRINIIEIPDMEDTLITDYEEEIMGQLGKIYIKHENDTITGISLLGEIMISVELKGTKDEVVGIIDQLKSGS